MLSTKFASYALYNMTKDEQGKDLVSVQATFQNELEICEAHIRHHGRDIYDSQLMKPLDMVLEAAMPTQFPVLRLTCCRCKSKKGICDLEDPSLPRGFNDEHFKKDRPNRTCFSCLSYSGKRWKLSVKGQEYIRCGCCDCFKLSGQLKTVEEVHSLNTSTIEHFNARQPLVKWVREDVRDLRICAEKKRQLCQTCFARLGRLPNYPLGPACECGVREGHVTKEAMQSLDAEVQVVLMHSKPQNKQPSGKSLWDGREVVCLDCYVQTALTVERMRKYLSNTAASKTQKRALDESDAAEEGASRDVKRRAIVKDA